MMAILGWIVWSIFVYWAWTCVRIIFGVNGFGESGLQHVMERRLPTILTFIDGLVGLVIALTFVLFDLNKYHILWVWPLMVISIIILGGIFYKIGLLKGALE
jgi:hypothetical protein